MCFGSRIGRLVAVAGCTAPVCVEKVMAKAKTDGTNRIENLVNLSRISMPFKIQFQSESSKFQLLSISDRRGKNNYADQTLLFAATSGELRN
jgi:hypothetical protein